MNFNNNKDLEELKQDIIRSIETYGQFGGICSDQTLELIEYLQKANKEISKLRMKEGK